MKKLIITAAFVCSVLAMKGQLKVYSGGKIATGTTSTVTPTYNLDVTAGDLNVGASGTTNGYRLGTSYILWNNNKSGCIYVGGGGSSANTGTNNIFLGSGTGSLNTASSENVAVGYQALKTQDYSTAMSTYNVAVGNGALFTNNPTSTSNGYKNTAVGHNAGYQNTIAYGNVFIGFEAAKLNKATSDNVAVGYQALYTQAYFATPFSSQNTAVGYQALFTNNPTLTTNGYDNTALGYKSGYSNSTGSANLFCGDYAGYTNATASGNAFLCHNAGYFNLTGAQNVALGLASSYYNSTGSNNTAVGYGAGQGASGYNHSNNSFFGYKAGNKASSGSNNVFSGYQAGYNTTTGGHNVYIGVTAGYNNTSGTQNVAIGNYAGDNPGSTTNNTYVGYNADDNADCSNCAAIGANTVAAATNKMYFGDANVTWCYNYTGNWGSYSDGRFKNNVQENVKGLDFINKLRPVTYKVNTQSLDGFLRQNMKPITDSLGNAISQNIDYTASMSLVHSGFIAQEVEQALNETGFQSSSIVSAPTHSNEAYALSYAGFVVPLVKAVQELSGRQDSLISVIATLKGGLRTNDSQDKTETTLQVELDNMSKIILYEAQPNPFSTSTVIKYFIPENISGNAYVSFHDMYGNEVNKIEVKEKGFGKIEANTENLAAGIYSYSIVVGDKVVDTKKMIRNK